MNTTNQKPFISYQELEALREEAIFTEMEQSKLSRCWLTIKTSMANLCDADSCNSVLSVI